MLTHWHDFFCSYVIRNWWWIDYKWIITDCDGPHLCVCVLIVQSKVELRVVRVVTSLDFHLDFLLPWMWIRHWICAWVCTPHQRRRLWLQLQLRIWLSIWRWVAAAATAEVSRMHRHWGITFLVASLWVLHVSECIVHFLADRQRWMPGFTSHVSKAHHLFQQVSRKNWSRWKFQCCFELYSVGWQTVERSPGSKRWENKNKQTNTQKKPHSRFERPGRF